MYYAIEIRPSALREMKKLSPEVRKRLGRKIETLARNPRPAGHKKLKNARVVYRIRAGNYRIVYQIKDEERHIVVARVRHRREAY